MENFGFSLYPGPQFSESFSFAYIMEVVVQDLCFFPSYYLIPGIRFVYNIISLKSDPILQRRNSINLKKFSERICVVEFNCWNLLKSYDMSMDETLSLLLEILSQGIRT